MEFHQIFVCPSPAFRFLWHKDCSINFMAKKMNSLQLAQTARAEAEASNRRFAPSMGALSLMQPRSQAVNIFPTRRRLQITIDGETGGQIPQSVKITHAA
jgi:hypothetical protein